MSSIFRMMFLHFASICFPSKVLTVDKRNSFICFIRSNVMMMSIKSFSWNSVSIKICWFLLHIWLSFWCNLSKTHVVGIKLQISGICWFWWSIFRGYNFVLSGDYSNFDWVRIGFDLNSFFHIVVSILFTKKALDFMFIKRACFIILASHFLDKTNHCFVTLSIKLIVIACLQRQKFISSILCWILWNLWLDWIFKIRNKSQSIIKFHLETLIINVWPITINMLLFTCSTSFTESSFSLEFVH